MIGLRTLPRIMALAVLLAATPAVLAQVTAENDPGLLERIIQNALGGDGRDVQIRGLQGPLSGTPSIAEITVADSDGIWLSIRDVTLDWQRLAIFRRQLDVNALTVGEIDIARAPLPPPASLARPEAGGPEPDAEPGGFALPDLPVSVEIDTLTIGALRLGVPLIGQAAALSVDGAARLAGGEGNVRLRLARQDGPDGLFDLEAGFSNTTRRLIAELDVREAEGGLIATLARIPGAPPLALSVSGDDPISAFEAVLALSTDGAERLAGTVRLSESPVPGAGADAVPAMRQTLDAAIGGDVTPLFIPDYQAFFGPEVALDLRATRTPEAGISVETLALTAAALDLDASLELSSSLAPRLIDVTGRISDPLGLPVVLPLPGPATLIGSAEIDMSFDAAAGDGLVVVASLRDLQRADGLLVDDVDLRGTGVLRLSDTNGIAAATAAVTADLGGLSIADPQFAEAAGDSATLSAQVDWLSEAGRLALRDIDLRSDAVRLTGTATVTGLAAEDTPRIALDADLASGPLARFADLAGTALTGSIETALRGSFAPETGAFDVALDGAGRELAIGQPEVDALLAGPLALDLTAARGTDGLRVDRLALRTDAVEVTGGGRLASVGGAMQLDAEIADLSVLGDAALSGPLTLEAELTGEADIWDASVDLVSSDARITGDGTIENLFGGPISATADVEIDTGSLSRLASLAGLPLEGSLSLVASGRFDAMTGNAALTADGTGRGLAIGQPQLDALLSGPITLAVTAARDGESIVVDRLEVDGRAVAVSGGGRINGKDGALSLAAEMPELALLGIPSLSGPLSLNASLEGENDLWDAAVTLVSNEASVVGTAEIDQLMAGAIDASGSARIETGNLARFAPLAGMPLTGRVSLQADGRFDAASGDAALTATGSGAGLSVGIPEADALLTGPLTLGIDGERRDGDIRIDTATFGTNQVALAVTGAMQDGAGRFDLTAGLRDLGALVAGLSGPMNLRGAVEGAGRVWDAAGNLTGPNGISAVIAGGVIRPDGAVDLSITGGIPLLIAEPFISPRTLVGDAAFDLALRGQPGLGALSGTVTVDDARFQDPGTRQVIEDIDLTVSLTNATATIGLAARPAGGGTITVNGPVNLTPPFDASVAAALQEVRLVDPTLYEASLFGNANIQGPLAGGAAITAGIVIDRAEIKIPSGLGGPGALPEIIHVAEPDASRDTRRRAGLEVDSPEQTAPRTGGPVYGLDVTIAAPRQIFVRGRGLDVEMGGGITIGGTTASPITGGGIRLLRGQMALLGQRLEFEKAEINLQGNLVPDLDMVAFSSSSSVRAFIEITGPVTAPDIAFRSQPELPEDEVLAQLFFGKPINQLNPVEVAQLLASVNRLTGGGGPDVLGQFRDGLGLDRLGVTSDDEGNTEVTAGRYLSERLFTDVTVGADGTSEIELNYDFNSTLRGRAAVDSAGDSSIGFAFERDF